MNMILLKTHVSSETTDRPIYWPILSASVGVDKRLLYSLCIQTTCAREHNEASQDSYLAAGLAVAFHKQSDKINHGACVGRHSRNKNIIGKFRNA